MQAVTSTRQVFIFRLNKKAIRHNTKPDGFSLVELLVAMTLGLLLLTGMITVFAGNKRSSDLNAAMANLQESARFALEAIAADARMSGFQGCMELEKGEPLIVATGWPRTDPDDATSPLMKMRDTVTTGSVVGKDNWTPPPPLGFDPDDVDALPGTHVLSLQFGGPDVATLTSQMIKNGKPDRSASVTINVMPDGSHLPLETGDFAIISNCNSSDVFRVTSVDKSSSTSTVIHHTTALNSTPQLQRPYGDARNINQTLVMRLNSNVYYVADTGLVNDTGDMISALYMQTLPYGDATNPPVEMVQGIENLRVAFGVRNTDGSLRYVTPGSAGYDPSNIESVRLGVLMSSRDQIAEHNDTNTYELAGQTILAANGTNTGPDTHPADRRFRLAFNTTVKIRNRRNN